MKKEKIVLSPNEYKAIYRILADSIEVFTVHSHPESVRFVVDSALSKYRSLDIDKNDSVDTNVGYGLCMKIYCH